ncbi:hypothetical protein CN692_07490 [Bacillus sp. AFS002410]|uniref:hypothetical protein n=1 Tax=Bacillus sp. AFS002410 TaxID=2033481 RepID=UPI000BEF9DA9|nr:hypothetical protein [Bacillus sp. AFS002410]PEJ58811.1 hypothetical protein CN692_07490 [Bacillus sp. AFS002410]
MLKLIFFSIISIIGISLIMYIYVFFMLSNPEKKIKIDEQEISTKLTSINQMILIPTDFEVSEVYLLDDSFTSPHVEVNLSHEIKISVFKSIDLSYEGGKYVRAKVLNNINIEEYQTKDKRIIYIFNVDGLNYLYIFHEPYRKSIDEYLSKI